MCSYLACNCTDEYDVMQDERFLVSVDVNDTIPVDQMLDLNQNGLNFRAVDSNYSIDIYFNPLQVIALDNVTAWMIDEALSEQMLIDYLFAKKHGGDFLLRIEDTDQGRYVPGAEDYIQEALEWCGIKIDEGPKKEYERRITRKKFSESSCH